MRKKSNNRFSERYPLLHRLTSEVSWRRDEEEEKKTRAAFQRLDAQLLEVSDILPRGRLYLNSRQHDARIISVSRASSELVIRMEDYQSQNLAWALIEMYEHSPKNLRVQFPVVFRFSGVSSFTIARVSDNDKILPVSAARHLPRLSDYFYDEVIEVSPGLLSMGMLILTRNRRGPLLLLEVKCQELNIQEEQRPAFKAFFGEQHMELFDTFMEARHDRAAFFNWSTTCEFIRQWISRDTNPSPSGSRDVDAVPTAASR